MNEYFKNQECRNTLKKTNNTFEQNISYIVGKSESVKRFLKNKIINISFEDMPDQGDYAQLFKIKKNYPIVKNQMMDEIFKELESRKKIFYGL